MVNSDYNIFVFLLRKLFNYISKCMSQKKVERRTGDMRSWEYIHGEGTWAPKKPYTPHPTGMTNPEIYALITVPPKGEGDKTPIMSTISPPKTLQEQAQEAVDLEKARKKKLEDKKRAKMYALKRDIRDRTRDLFLLSKGIEFLTLRDRGNLELALNHLCEPATKYIKTNVTANAVRRLTGVDVFNGQKTSRAVRLVCKSYSLDESEQFNKCLARLSCTLGATTE